MEWTAERVSRLYELYERHIDRLRTDVVKANRSLGSTEPEKTNLEILNRAEFEALLRRPTDDPEVTRLWVRRIIRGHEQEFPELESGPSERPRRRTGT
jgi:hypothetical protein